jgi:hypothetical protein
MMKGNSLLAIFLVICASAVATPRITVSETWHESIQNDPHFGPYVLSRAAITASATGIPNTWETSQFNELTTFNMFHASGTLGGGSDPYYIITSTYRRGATSAVLNYYMAIVDNFGNTRRGPLVHTVSLSWNKQTVNASCTSIGDFLDLDLPDDFTATYTGNFTGQMQFSFGFDFSNDFQWPLFSTGRGTVTPTDMFGDLRSGSLVAQGDFTGPVVTITSPRAHTSTTNPVTHITGMVSDNGGITALYWRSPFGDEDPRLGYNGFSDWQTVDLTTAANGKSATWSLDMSNWVGTNVIWLVASDPSGNFSKVAVRDYFYSVLRTLNLRNNGPGTIVAPRGFTNGAQLEIGRGYVLGVRPTSTNVFFNWSDGSSFVISSERVYNFIMPDPKNVTPNGGLPDFGPFTLQANFGSNPYGPIASNYVGLFTDVADGADVSNSGYVQLTTTPKGDFTGTVFFGANRYPVSGYLTRTGMGFPHGAVASFAVETPHDELIFDVSFGHDEYGNLAPMPGGRMFSAVNGFVNDLTMTPCHYDSNAAPVGTYNVWVPGAAWRGTDGPLGDGYGTVVVTKSGQANVTLHFPDSPQPPVTFTGAIGADNRVPFYSSLNGGAGMIMGWLSFTNDIVNVVHGDNIVWSKEANATNKFYPEGFTNLVTIDGSRYIAPRPGTNLFQFDEGTFTYLSDDLLLKAQVAFNENTGALTVVPGHSDFANLVLRFIPATGIVQGTATISAGNSVNFTAELVPKDTFAYGYALGTNASASVEFGPY